MRNDDTTTQEPGPGHGLLAVIAVGVLTLAACGDASPSITEDTYPPALRPTPGADLSSMAGGCPDLDFVTEGELTVDQALGVLTAFATDDADARREVSDTAFWLLLSDVGVSAEPLTEDRIEVGAAADAPHAELLANACGELTVRASRWVQLCPGPCNAPGGSQSLISHWYLIERQGRWLVWASE